MRLFTIGFTGKSAETFFEALRGAQVARVVDVRLHNTSQLAGFSKRDDLRYFLRTIIAIDYVAEPLLAPTPQMLRAYRNQELDWSQYQGAFLDLMAERRIESALSRALFDEACLLCSEAAPHHCHRRLVAEYLQRHWPELTIAHLPRAPAQ